MLCTMCSGGGLLGPTSARYWSVVNTQRTWLSSTHINLSNDRQDPCFDVNGCSGYDLKATCRNWCPPSLILFPALKPHNHHYNVSKMLCLRDALELLSEAWLYHVLCFIFNPRDYVHQRWMSESHQFFFIIIRFKVTWSCLR